MVFMCPNVRYYKKYALKSIIAKYILNPESVIKIPFPSRESNQCH